MKIERLSENTIRCTLNRDDLDSRELKISELAYGTEKAKGLFKDMIAMAYVECGFEADDIPLMIEAIPISPDCIVLMITKVEDPEELDTRFSKFAPSDDDTDYSDMLDSDDDSMHDYADTDSLINKLNSSLSPDENFIPILETLGKDVRKPGASVSYSGGEAGTLTDGNAASPESVKLEKLFSFRDFSMASNAAAAVYRSFDGDSILYKNASNSRYYLLLESGEMKPDEFTGVCNILTEYGIREKFSYATLAYLDEHDEVIIRKDALKILATI